MEQGIGALTSDYGRAAQAKAQQMQKGGASLDQIQQELYGSVMKGLLPFQVAAELFQQLKQPPKTPASPPDGTVINDMAKILAKRDSGIASLPAPAMDEANFAGGGIVAFSGSGGSLVPNGGKIYPVGPYRGPATAASRALIPAASAAASAAPGIASRAGMLGRFLTGKGPWLTAAGLGLSVLPYLFGNDEKVEAEPEESTSAEPEKYEMPAATGAPQVGIPRLGVSTAGYDKEIARQEGRMKDLEPKEREEYIQQQRQMLEDAGVNKVTKQREEALARRQEDYEQEKGKAGLMSLARAGFEMAAAASQPGATLFGSAASGALRGIEDYGNAKERLRQTESSIQDAQFQLAEAGSMREYAAMQGGDALHREAQKTYDETSARLSALVIGREAQVNDVLKTQFTAGVQVAVANAQLLADAGKNDLARQISQLVNMSTKFWAEGKPQKAQAYLDRAKEIVNSTAPQVLGKQAGLPNMGATGINPEQWGNDVTTTAPKVEE